MSHKETDMRVKGRKRHLLVDTTGNLLKVLMTAAGADGVLNGIAYDSDHDTFLITGKLWPRLFEVQFVPKP